MVISGIVRDVYCEILLRDVEYLLDKYLAKTRKVCCVAHPLYPLSSTLMIPTSVSSPVPELQPHVLGPGTLRREQ